MLRPASKSFRRCSASFSTSAGIKDASVVFSELSKSIHRGFKFDRALSKQLLKQGLLAW